MNDEALRQWYRARQPRLDAGSHPAPEALVAVVRREGTEADRLATVDHVMACPDCQADFELLRSIRAAAPSARPLPRWALLAAAVVVAVGAGTVWRLMTSEGGRLVRDGAGGDGLELVSPADSAIAEGQRAFVWRAVPGTSGYRFELVANNGRLAHAALVVDTTVVVPDSVTIPAGSYRWWVTASSPKGDRVSPFRAIEFR